MRDLVEIKVSEPVAELLIINSGDPASCCTVTLNSNITKEENQLKMRFKNAGGNWTDWEKYSNTKITGLYQLVMERKQYLQNIRTKMAMLYPWLTVLSLIQEPIQVKVFTSE